MYTERLGISTRIPTGKALCGPLRGCARHCEEGRSLSRVLPAASANTRRHMQFIHDSPERWRSGGANLRDRVFLMDSFSSVFGTSPSPSDGGTST